MILEGVGFPAAFNTTTPNETAPTTAKKDKKKGKVEEMVLNLHPSNTVKHKSAIMRDVQYEAEIVFKNDKYIIPVTFELSPERKTNQIIVFESHRKVFTATKMIDNINMILTEKKSFLSTLSPLPRDENTCSIYSPTITEDCSVCCQVESSIMISKLKNEEKFVMSNLLNNTTYIKYDKFNTHREDSID